MTERTPCAVCRRSSFMGKDDTVGPVCAECLEDYGRHLRTALPNPFECTATWAADRAWGFALAQADATFAPRPGDPGHSRTPSRVRRRR